MKWFTMSVYDGKEEAVKQLLERKTKIEGINLGRVFYPTEKVIKTVSSHGKSVRSVVERPLMPGYLFFEVDGVSNVLWHIIKSIQYTMKVIPQPVADAEIAKLIAANEAPKITNTNLTNGADVKVVAGPFVNNIGKISGLDDKTVNVVLTIFGRNTTLTVDRSAVELV